jgi:hypothetical protein
MSRLIISCYYIDAENGRFMGSMTGVQTATVADKIWLIFQALGDISFSYPYSMLFLEIQVTKHFIFKFE